MKSSQISPASDPIYRVHGRISATVVGVYVVLGLLIVFVVGPREGPGYAWVTYGLVAFLLFLLIRYLTVTYTLTDTQFRARRFLGGRTLQLEEIRRIERASLRELAPTGPLASFGPIGWRGRMWSPEVGQFDSVFSDAAQGLLITATGNPLFVSPKDPDLFARELSRRVRSYTGPLEHDVGLPSSDPQ